MIHIQAEGITHKLVNEASAQAKRDSSPPLILYSTHAAERLASSNDDIRMLQVGGITLRVLKKALAQAKVGRQHNLEQMQACNPATSKN